MDPETGIILFIVGGIGTVVSFGAYKVAQQIGDLQGTIYLKTRRANMNILVRPAGDDIFKDSEG